MFDIDKIRAQWAKQRPDIDTEPMALIGLIIRLSAHLSSEMTKTFAKHGLNAASFDVLATLLRSGRPYSLSPNDLLATMMVTSGTMTNRIDQLEKEGLVERIQNPGDKRSVLVQLTVTGRQIIDAAVTDHVATQSRLVQTIPAADRVILNDVLQNYLSNIDTKRNR